MVYNTVNAVFTVTIIESDLNLRVMVLIEKYLVFMQVRTSVIRSWDVSVPGPGIIYSLAIIVASLMLKSRVF